MRANDISQAAYDAEKELQSKIAGVVAEVMNDLSEKTGLDLGSVTVHMLDSTLLSSRWREYRVARVEIQRDLPAPISMEG